MINVRYPRVGEKKETKEINKYVESFVIAIVILIILMGIVGIVLFIAYLVRIFPMMGLVLEGLLAFHFLWIIVHYSMNSRK